jgi:hypothetical protein
MGAGFAVYRVVGDGAWVAVDAQPEMATQNPAMSRARLFSDLAIFDF